MAKVLSNEQWIDRARIGLARWHCDHNHTPFHRITSLTHDSKWDVWDSRHWCSRCRSTWTREYPLHNVISRCMCRVMGPTIQGFLWDKDPVFSLLEKVHDN